jgi:hypothetical protein
VQFVAGQGCFAACCPKSLSREGIYNVKHKSKRKKGKFIAVDEKETSDFCRKVSFL